MVMAINFSSAANVSLPTLTPTTTVYEYLCECLDSEVGAYSITIYTMILIILLAPLCTYIVYLSHEQWRQQNSHARMSDSDFFTYHMVIIELINIVGFILCCFGVFFHLKEMLGLSIYFLPFSFCGQLLFHTLTCVERYLAVVHPITYMDMKKTHGIKIRNIIIVTVWIFCLSGIHLVAVVLNIFINLVCFVMLPSALIIMLYCSIVVLCVLIRPGPGKVVRQKQLMDQSKLRAFYTIVSILGALLMRFGGNIVITIFFLTLKLSNLEKCGLWLANLIVCLPCSLALPLLFLHRAAKLPWFKSRKQSGQD